MQLLPGQTESAARSCAWELLDAVPPMMWFIRREMRAHRRGLSMPQFRAMCMISNEPDTSLSLVAEQLALSLPTTSRIVTGLVKKGLLKRTDCRKDRRQLELVVTAKGRDVLNHAWGAAMDAVARQLPDLSPAELNATVKAMRALKPIFGSLGLPRD